MIIFAAFMVGVVRVGKLSKRISVLSSFLNLFRYIKQEINYNVPSLPYLFSSYSDTNISDFTSELGSSLLQCSSISECVVSVMKQSSQIETLSSADKEALQGFLCALGTSDVQSQNTLLENAVSKLDDLISEAVKAKDANAKVYMVTSLYIGIALAVLMI